MAKLMARGLKVQAMLSAMIITVAAASVFSQMAYFREWESASPLGHEYSARPSPVRQAIPFDGQPGFAKYLRQISQLIMSIEPARIG
ncbi:hypothetical protein BH10CHL1_BH10CHL1_49270 [soil metagenome]